MQIARCYPQLGLHIGAEFGERHAVKGEGMEKLQDSHVEISYAYECEEVVVGIVAGVPGYYEHTEAYDYA